MIRGKLIHPGILEALGQAGHGSGVLIADGNYPFATKLGPNAALVQLNLSPGLITATQALEALLTAIPVEAAAVMAPPASGPYAQDDEPAIWREFRDLLERSQEKRVELERIPRFEFYEAASAPDVALTIATGEQRIFANVLLTIGVVLPS